MAALRLGVLFSTSGDYGALGRDCRDGAMTAIEELRDVGSIEIEPVFGDPAGSSERYIELARKMLQDDGCRHMIGTVTSQARKDVIPVIEKHDAQLWYVCPYEGFEANANVIYTGACPNQHLCRFSSTCCRAFGARVYLAGANYIWGWEMNRLAREIVTEAGGEIVGERCLPIGETEVDRLVAEIAARRPDFILSNMLGPSSHAFLRAMRDLGQRDPAFRPEHCPVVSCDLTECEIARDRPRRRRWPARRRILFRQSGHAREPRSQSAGRSALRLGAAHLELFRDQLCDGSPCVEAVSALRNATTRRRSAPPSPASRRRVPSDRCASTRPPTTPVCRSCSAAYRAKTSSSFSPGRARSRTPISSAGGRPRRGPAARATAQDRVMKTTPSFLGQKAVILHRPGETTDRLVRQSACLDCAPKRAGQPLSAVEGVDIVLVDADEGWDGLLPVEPV